MARFPEYMRGVETGKLDSYASAFLEGITPYDQEQPQSFSYALASVIRQLEEHMGPNDFAPHYLRDAVEIYAGMILFPYVEKIVQLDQELKRRKINSWRDSVNISGDNHIYTLESEIWPHVLCLPTQNAYYLVLLRFGDLEKGSRAAMKQSWIDQGTTSSDEKLEQTLDYLFKPQLHIRTWDIATSLHNMVKTNVGDTDGNCPELRYGDFRDTSYVGSLDEYGKVPGALAYAKVLHNAIFALAVAIENVDQYL